MIYHNKSVPNLENVNWFFVQKDAMLREYQSEIEKLKQMIEKGGFEGGEVVPSEVFQINIFVVLECK